MEVADLCCLVLELTSICCINENPQSDSTTSNGAFIVPAHAGRPTSWTVHSSPSSSLTWDCAFLCLLLPTLTSQEGRAEGRDVHKIASVTRSRPLSLPTGSNTIPFLSAFFNRSSQSSQTNEHRSTLTVLGQAIAIKGPA